MPTPATRTRFANSPSGTTLSRGSATQTLTTSAEASRSVSPDPLVLRLRGARVAGQRSRSVEQTQEEEEQPTTRRRRIQWAEDVVDNEGLGRKKSKVCCIFHKTRAVGESSSEDDSDSSSSSDSDAGSGISDDGGARPVGGGRRARGRKGRRKHGRDHGHEHGDNPDGCDGHAHANGEKRRPSPNAYERMPKYDVKPLERQPGT